MGKDPGKGGRREKRILGKNERREYRILSNDEGKRKDLGTP